ncbi:hypothetical protein ACHWQZ_G017423 [Mnemiopsis leidyi]
MYSLLSGLVKYVLKKDEYCVLIIGLDNAGKTTLLEQVKTSYCHNSTQFPLDKIVPTVGLNVGKIATQGVKLTLWDMGGQDALRTLWKDYFLSCHGIVYVVDSEDEERLLDSRDVFLKVCHLSQSGCLSQGLSSFPVGMSFSRFIIFLSRDVFLKACHLSQ